MVNARNWSNDRIIRAQKLDILYDTIVDGIFSDHYEEAYKHLRRILPGGVLPNLQIQTGSQSQVNSQTTEELPSAPQTVAEVPVEEEEVKYEEQNTNSSITPETQVPTITVEPITLRSGTRVTLPINYIEPIEEIVEED